MLSPEIEEDKVRDEKWSQTELFGRESNSIDTPEEKEGTFSAFVEWDGTRHDMHLYGLLRSEWLE